VHAVAASTAGTDASAIDAIETVIRKFLAANHPEQRAGDHDRSRQPPARRDLWREVSSLTLLQLVAFVEQKFAIKVRPIDFAPQNFSTVQAIARFVAARQPRAADR
jgi:acyl carrier protein